MDPLSGLVQTAIGIGQALQFLRSLNEIPNEFKALLEELSTLQSIIRHVEGAVTELESTGRLVPGPGSPLEGIDTSIIVSLKNDLIQVSDHVSALCDRLKKSRSLRTEGGEENDNKERVSKYKWQKEKGNIAKLQEKARTTREQLVLCLSVFNSSQVARQARLMHEFFGTTQAILRLQEQHNQQLHLQCNVHLERQDQGPVDENQASQTGPVSVVAAEAIDATPNVREVSGPRSSQLVQIPGPFLRRCHISCVCVCHQPQRLQSPGILSAWLGSLVMHSRAFSALSAAECDYANCKTKLEASLRLMYTFPRWLLARSVEVVISWSSLTGAGSSLHLRVPRVLEKHDAWLAIDVGDLEWIQRSLTMKRLYPTDIDEFGVTLVSRAVRRCHIHIVAFFAQVGSDVHATDKFGSNAAMEATWFLADSDYGNQHLAAPERTILEKIASSWGELDGEDLDLDGSAESILAQATPTNAHLNRLDRCGRAPLHVAAERGDVDTLTALLKAGAELNVTDFIGETPLFHAVRRHKVKCAELLLGARADANFTNAYGRTPIFFAFHSPEILSLLLSYGANVCIPPDSRGFSDPLNWEAGGTHDWTHHDETTEMWAKSLDLLISAGLDINSRAGFWQLTPLLVAFFNQNAPLAELLIDRGAQVTAVDSKLHTIFHYAAYRPQVECIQVLRQAKISNVDPNAINIYGDTPMDIINWQASKPNLGPGVRRIDQGLIQLFSEMIQEARQRFTESSWKGESDVESDAGEVGAEDNMQSNPNAPASNPTSPEIVTSGQGQRGESQEDQYHDTDTEQFFDAQP